MPIFVQVQWSHKDKFLKLQLLGAFFFSRLVVSDFVTPWTAARQPSLSFTISQSLLKPLSGNAYICDAREILSSLPQESLY